MREKTTVIANWKMHGTASLLEASSAALADPVGCDFVLCPPHPLLYPAKAVAAGRWAIGAQDCHWEQEGAFTGEVSPQMLKDAGASHVIIGHSERRTIMGETNEYVHDKIQAALAQDLIPVVCIGESLTEYQAKDTYAVLSSQIFEGLPKNCTDKNLIIAYEPIWAIGSGLTPSLKEVQDCHDHIRTYLSALISIDYADQTPILYGGSVKPDNVADLVALKDVDGVLVGGASLKPDSLAAILNAVS